MPTKQEIREQRRQQLKAEAAAWRQRVIAQLEQGTPERVQAAVKNTINQFMWDWVPEIEYTTTRDVDGTCYDRKSFFSSVTIPAGTKGWLRHEMHHKYDRYVWDKFQECQYPAKDAKIVETRHYYNFCCLSKDSEGNDVLVDAFHSTVTKPQETNQ